MVRSEKKSLAAARNRTSQHNMLIISKRSSLGSVESRGSVDSSRSKPPMIRLQRDFGSSAEDVVDMLN